MIISWEPYGLIGKPIIAVAVSGGADSMALALLAKDFADQHSIKLIALTVDHGLRKEAADESSKVKKWLTKRGIEHHTLKFKGTKPTSNIQEKARKIRYSLMLEWCRKAEVQDLLVAHHALDQAETFLMRLERGSGVDGLAAMVEISEMENVRIIRPLLHIMPNTLRSFLENQKQPWIEDPSNSNTAYRRSRLRQMLAEIGDARLIQRLNDTARHMRRARKALESQVNMLLETSVSRLNPGYTISLNSFLGLQEEIALRLLTRLLEETGQSSVRFEDLERLYKALQSLGFKRRSLGKCLISIKQGEVWIMPEKGLKGT